MSTKVAEIRQLLTPDNIAWDIANFYQSGVNMRRIKTEEIKELRNYLFATDTTKTSNKTLPWKNSTTLPKLTQLRDILHTNYMNALFPNDRWLQWEGHSLDAEIKEKRAAILAYMENKLRIGDFKNVMSDLLYDYIDNGNVFGDCEFVTESYTTPEDEVISNFIGPKALRLSFYDIVFDPTATCFKESWSVTRYLKGLGQLMKEVETRPELAKVNKEVLNQVVTLRQQMSGYEPIDIDKAEGFQIDGFGSLSEYFQSGKVEVLEFQGDYYDMTNEKLHENRHVWVVDRAFVIYNEPIDTWTGKSTKEHVGWRDRPDNVYAMGPLDNLVGMQYRIDHLENLKADAMDLAVLPPLAISGDVPEFEYGPKAVISLGDEGQVTELGKSLQGVLAANNEISILENKMEDLAGAPKEAAGIRTPGEKTMFEVQSLENARGRIFQHKIARFEWFMEKMLNNMLEVARRNMTTTDLIRVMDDDNGVISFMKITKEDITAEGKLRAIGSRHFAASAQLMQNLTTLVNTGLFEFIKPHMSPKKTATMVENVMGFDRFEIFSDNAFIFEQAETQKMINGAQDEVDINAVTPVDEEEI